MAWKKIWYKRLIFRLTENFTLRSRRKRFNLFIDLLKPGPDDKILDIGISSYIVRGTNFLEMWYPYQKNITCLVNEDIEKYKDFKLKYPEVKIIQGDGKKMDFPAHYFDIVFSNAVIEHVGRREEQKKFIHEIIRVGKKSFISTPNYRFPIDSHTLFPFIHMFPRKIKFWIYKKIGRGYFSDINRLNLLRLQEFIKLFPAHINIKIYKQKVLGLTTNFIALITHPPECKG
ncbi:MAG: methyltransferase domain-containing protein [Spirochaetales bacterium]|nr:methyltransferase domain-containing protein [Spirochaetales bacterium]